MKLTAKIRKFKNKKLKLVEEVRAALIAILEDIQSGDATISEAKDRKSTRLNSSHPQLSRMPSSA